MRYLPRQLRPRFIWATSTLAQCGAAKIELTQDELDVKRHGKMFLLLPHAFAFARHDDCIMRPWMVMHAMLYLGTAEKATPLGLRAVADGSRFPVRSGIELMGF